jgi:hypothetical protein
LNLLQSGARLDRQLAHLPLDPNQKITDYLFVPIPPSISFRRLNRNVAHCTAGIYFGIPVPVTLIIVLLAHAHLGRREWKFCYDRFRLVRLTKRVTSNAYGSSPYSSSSYRIAIPVRTIVIPILVCGVLSIFLILAPGVLPIVLILTDCVLSVLLVAASRLLVGSNLAVWLTAPILPATAALRFKTSVSRASRRSPRRRKSASARWTFSGKATPSSSSPSTATAPAPGGF